MLVKIKNYLSNNTGILIRLDDIAENMNWELMDRSEALFNKFNIKPVIGVIPKNQDKDLLSYPKKDNFWDLIRIWQSKGWEVSMHGHTHVYDTETNKKDYFGYGGRSEFFGHPLNVQKERIQSGLRKFKDENIEIKSFFAPNHTYDFNTFNALKESGINEVIDGYGLMPYEENEIKFIPQLFYKVYALPFGIQSTQIHLNYWKEEDFKTFENFVEKNHEEIISYDDAIKKVSNKIEFKLLNSITKNLLRAKRTFSNFKS